MYTVVFQPIRNLLRAELGIIAPTGQTNPVFTMTMFQSHSIVISYHPHHVEEGVVSVASSPFSFFSASLKQAPTSVRSLDFKVG